ncbi:MAG: Asp-tRNA(Asn)/Glu-tRNA(Gln) amidotransferase subunit GatC [Patescibacteria group bacterium]|nr:Asp-tRNA(Asn)/Glu-tRNA(Gln) amidotransferase subunit GatC [Patescibacteria group bacterium]
MKINKVLVKKIAQLAQIPVSEKEEEKLAKGFEKTIEIVDELFKVDVFEVQPIHQVTSLENIFREDKIDEKRMFSQNEALNQAKNKHNGYFVVDQILEED